MGKDNTVVQEEKTSLKMCTFVPSTVMSSWEHVAAMSCSCLTDAIPQRIIGQAGYYRSLVLWDKIINIIVRWLQVVPVCMDTYTVLIIMCLVTNIWNDDSSLMLPYGTSTSSTPMTTTSIYNYIGYYSSAVGLDVLRFEQCLFCCRLSMIALRFEQCLPFVNDSATFIVSWCYHLLMLVKH